MLVQEPVQAAIWHCLNHYAYKDAIFLAERLNAELQSEETLFLLATCYYRANRRNQCYSILHSNYESEAILNSRCKFLLAQVCVEMNKFSEAEQILLSEQKPKEEPIETVVNNFGDSSPFACQLLGHIANQTARLELAKDAYLRSLKLNPFLFDSFTNLCDMGENIDPNTIFQTTHLQNFSKCHGSQNLVSLAGGQNHEPVVMGVSNLNSIDVQHKFCTPVVNNRAANPSIKPIPVIIPSAEEGSGGGGLSVLHPTNKNRPVKYRHIYTSTPMGGKVEPGLVPGNNESGIDGTAGNVTSLNQQTGMGSATHNSSSVTSPQSTFGFGFVPLESSTEASTFHSFSCNSPFLVITPSPAGSGGGDSSEPRAKKPCLRVPHSWQQPQAQAGSFLVSHNVNFHTPGGNLTTSTVSATTAIHTATPTTPGPQTQPLNPQTANVRRSSRLFSNSNVSVKENNKTPPRSRVTPSKSPSRKNKLRNSTNKPNTPTVTSNNKDPTLQENQKNSQIIAEDYQQLGPTVIEEEPGTEYKYVTPLGTDKTISSMSDVNILHSDKLGNPIPGLLSPFPNNIHPQLAQTALTLQKQSAEGLMSLFRHLGKGYLHLCQYECKDTLTCFSSLKENHMNSGWVLSQKARALLELGDNEEAAKCYNTMRQNEPARMDGLEWLSTALWHLQSEIELSALAHDLLTLDKEHPATWIASGNCFSLHKEHDTAIRFFERAVQVDPMCAYGYTLLGHEYVAAEELDKAMRCFRNAARLDRRHYNAWYGIGMIYYKQERYVKAELYYRKALKVHPNNSVLLCHLGVVQHALGRTEQSLQTFNKALSYNPQNPLCKFHRASVLFAASKLEQALQELEELKQIVPKESLVYFLIAKVYSKQGETHKALLHFSWATDLDPKGANNQIKESIEPVLSRSLSALTMSEGPIADAPSTPTATNQPSNEMEGPGDHAPTGERDGQDESSNSSNNSDVEFDVAGSLAFLQQVAEEEDQEDESEGMMEQSNQSDSEHNV